LDIVTILNNSLLQKKKKSNKNSSSTSITNQQLIQQSNHIYNALNAIDGNDGFTVDLIYEILENCGILSNDPRIQSFLPSLPVVRSSFPLFCLFFFVLLLLKIIPLFFFFFIFKAPNKINASHFTGISQLLLRALQGELAIPDWPAFTKISNNIYNLTLLNKEGHNADYIPVLANANPDKFGVSVCTIDGQRYNIGDTKEYWGVSLLSFVFLSSIIFEKCN
jgi:hypothetical protein